jgi:small subunit ribosomal protein S8
MSFQDPIADLLTRIRNAAKAKIGVVKIPSSSLKVGIVKILKDEGFIKDFNIEGQLKKTLLIHLKYKGTTCAIQNVKQISKPSLRVYVDAAKLPTVLSGLGVSIVSTSKGVITGKQAKKENVGGEVLAYVW